MFVTVRTNVGEITIESSRIITWSYSEATQRLNIIVQTSDNKTRTEEAYVSKANYLEFVSFIRGAYTYMKIDKNEK